MRYLKCNHCGQLVEVKSEYMVFCPKCHEKLDNSFTAWHTRHPGGTFADYLSQHTVSPEAVSGLSQQRRLTRRFKRGGNLRRGGVALITALGMVLIFGAIYWGMHRDQRDPSLARLLDAPWRSTYYEDLGASIKFPHELLAVADTTSLRVKEDTTQIITAIATRRWSEPSKVSVTASRISYRPDFGVDRDIASSQILMSMLESGEVQGFEVFRNDYSIEGFSARILSGSYLIGPDPFEFRALMAQRRHTVWYFMVAYPRSAPEGLLIADRFFNGVVIE